MATDPPVGVAHQSPKLPAADAVVAGAASKETAVTALDAGADAETASANADAEARALKFLTDNARLADELVDEYCEEAKQLSPDDFPPAEGARTRDAWAYMAIRVDWEGGDRPPGLLRLGAPLRQRLREYGAEWPTRIRDYDLEGLDFTWMAELHQFDHWDVLRDVRANDPAQTTSMSVAIPNFYELMNWARLRLGRALQVGDFSATSADLQHLSFLLRTTGLVIADMVAYRILLLEREAHAAALAAGRDVGTWQPLPEEALASYKKVTRSGMQFMFPGVAPETMKRAFECSQIGRCSAMFEGVGGHRAFGAHAALDTSAQIATLAREAGCDPRTLEWLGRTRQVSAEEMLAGFSEGPNPLLLLAPDAGT